MEHAFPHFTIIAKAEGSQRRSARRRPCVTSCDFNSRVHAGELCATIDARPYQAAVDQAAANLEVARAQLKGQNADRTGPGYDRAAWGAAQCGAHQPRLCPHRFSLYGTVVARNITQGQTVAASFQTPTLFLIETYLTGMQYDTNVSESDIGRIMPGKTASMRILTGRADNLLRAPEQALRYRPSEAARHDEPTGNLGTSASHESMETLSRLNRKQGVLIIVVTHEPDIAAYASRAVTMRDGADGRNRSWRPPRTPWFATRRAWRGSAGRRRAAWRTSKQA